MTRTPIPSQAQEHARNAAQQAQRVSVALNSYATYDGLVSAETARKRAIDNLRALEGHIRTAKADIKRRETEAAKDLELIRQSAVMMGVG